MILTHRVSPGDNGKRVVDILRSTVGMSGLLTKRIRLYGTMTVNGIPSRMIDPAFTGDDISMTYREREVSEPEIVEGRSGIGILYSDRNIIIVVKPAGMVTHPTSNHQSGTLTDHFPELVLHPVSRLDRETSGIILIARDPHAHYSLALQHKNLIMKKEYLGIQHGIFNPASGVIDAPIKRRDNTIMLRCVSPDGAAAVTRYETVEKFLNVGASLVRFSLETGRTHQIRVHSLYAGHPIIGDGLYGASSNENAHYQRSGFLDHEISRQALHAASITFDHPITGQKLHFESPMPEDMALLLQNIRSLDQSAIF
ncbi:MAG: RluA family pseudouridine synthase [Saccharofermentanales bacterium]